ncbi:hypothetical protein ACFWVP_33055 [Streptomyces sp. NPDC058637]|uniref:hypothetical protein n=1 Tax=Streptomyces sp. NPDC058637 TaxID=3346569 RepID=UPI00365D113A
MSRGKGLAVPEARDGEATRIARMMLRVALAGRLLTAALTLAVMVATGAVTGYRFAGFSLPITVFRPAGAHFGQLRRAPGTLRKDVTFPRGEVLELREQADLLRDGTKGPDRRAQDQEQSLPELATRWPRRTAPSTRADGTDRRIAVLAREFETTVHRLTVHQHFADAAPYEPCWNRPLYSTFDEICSTRTHREGNHG